MGTSHGGDRLTFAVRWIARGLSLALVLLWGAFFIEHLSWFGSPEKPPLRVWLLVGLHFLMLVGYLVTLRWERTGSVIAGASAVTFFTLAAGRYAPWFILLGLVPLALYAYTWTRARHA
jgi:hypothetical protein